VNTKSIGTTMSDTADVARDFFAKMALSDFAAAFAMMADDVRYTVVGNTPASGTYEGVADLHARLGPLLGALRNLKTSLVEIIVEGDRAVAIMRAEADAPYGRYVQDPAVFIVRIAEGKVIELLEIVDTVMLETQVFGKKIV
jgi:ketosteroid isomerase-like protein